MAKTPSGVSFLALIPMAIDITATFYIRLLYALFRGSKGARTYRRDVQYAVMRCVLNDLNVEQSQYLSPNTDKVYKRVAKSKGWKPDIVDLDEGAKGNWIGKRNAKYVMIYFHGGGYIGYATPGHMKYQFQLQKTMEKAGHDFSILSLAYTLAPTTPYPTQLKQATSAVRYLLETEKRDPSTILIGGDSAGGNLGAALLGHLAHPHSALPAPPTLSAPLHGALLISPWICFTTTRPSFQANAQTDYLTPTGLDRCCHAFMRGWDTGHDAYSEPVRADPAWWQGTARVVDRVMVWGGGGEILIDGIREFGQKMQKGFAESEKTDEAAATTLPDVKDDAGAGTPAEAAGRVALVVTPQQAHEEMIIDYILRNRGKREGALAIEKWLSARLS